MSQKLGKLGFGVGYCISFLLLLLQISTDLVATQTYYLIVLKIRSLKSVLLAQNQSVGRALEAALIPWWVALPLSLQQARKQSHSIPHVASL